MNQQFGIPPSSRRQKSKKARETVPSLGQLAERFSELQRLRQKVREAESGQMAGGRAAPITSEIV
jgi:hypothetical protein